MLIAGADMTLGKQLYYVIDKATKRINFPAQRKLFLCALNSSNQVPILSRTKKRRVEVYLKTIKNNEVLLQEVYTTKKPYIQNWDKLVAKI